MYRQFYIQIKMDGRGRGERFVGCIGGKRLIFGCILPK